MTTQATSAVFDSTAAALREHADNPSAFLGLNEGNEAFSSPGLSGVVVYRPAGKYWIQFGGPFAAVEDRAELLTRFLAHAAERKRKIVSVQLQRSDAELYSEHGFTVNQLGASYAVDLSGFSLRGKKFLRLRNKISRAQRAGLEIAEVNPLEHVEAIGAVDAKWLRSKGRHVKELEFLVGELGGGAQPLRRFFLGTIAGVPTCYISYSPAYGSRPGWLHDLSRRVPDAPPGVMEAINVHAVERFQESGAAWLHFGFTPFSGLDPAAEVSASSGVVAKFIGFLAKHGDAVYPARSQVEYKSKWDPDVILPEYIAFQGRASFGAIWKILRITKSV
jgi:lysylphosphatidylglycerol synthetase-like protein (DUF2156 family)